MQTIYKGWDYRTVNLHCGLKNFRLYIIWNKWIEKSPLPLLQNEDDQDEHQGAADEGGAGPAFGGRPLAPQPPVCNCVFI